MDLRDRIQESRSSAQTDTECCAMERSMEPRRCKDKGERHAQSPTIESHEPKHEAHIFFVDDEPAIRMAVQRTLESAQMHVSVFSSAEACLAALARQACDVVITDVRLEGMDGLSLLREAKRHFPWLQVVLVTAYGDVPLAVEALKAGAADFVQKPLDREGLLSVVRNALKTARPISFPREAISHAEAQVLRLFLEGRTSKETAQTLKRSTRTVEAHRQRIMSKFGVHNAVQLAQKASTLWLGR
jgi:FixJ family two-component response regulator